jgi:hypothetical protein
MWTEASRKTMAVGSAIQHMGSALASNDLEAAGDMLTDQSRAEKGQ